MPNIHPPKFAKKLLLSFLRDELEEEVLGDLDEKFERTAKYKSVGRARINYLYEVLQYARPFALRKIKYSPYNPYTMYQSYVKVGWRNLLRHKGYSLINIGGLTVGMTIAMLIGLWVYDEMTFDHYHRNHKRVGQLLQHQTFNGYRSTGNAMPIPLEPELRRLYGDDFKYITTTSWTGDHILAIGDKMISKTGNFMGPDAPHLFDLRMLSGSADGLRDPNSILLSQSVARALFGDGDPINQVMRFDDKADVKVTGIYEDLPKNTTMDDIQFMVPFELNVSLEKWVKRARDEAQWGNNSFQVFAEIADNADMDKVNERIKDVKLNAVPEDDKIFKATIFIHPMKDWRLRSNWDNGVLSGGLIQYVWMFGIVGIFVLLLACINFMNLSTARSEQRAKEVGIRKSIGSIRSQLINQFLSESFLVVIIAFVLALMLVLLAIPSFNVLTEKQIVFPLGNPVFWLIAVAFISVTGFIAGSYPALYLSSFNPVSVLKGSFRTGKSGSLPRKILVVVQFTVSAILMIGTIVVYQQLQFTKNRPVGYDQQNVIMLQMRTPQFYGKYDVLRDELKNAGFIEEMAESSSPLTGVWSNNGGFSWDGKDPDLQADFGTIWVTHDFGDVVGWNVREGRSFSREYKSDTTAIVINEAAVKFMNIEKPVGKIVRWGDEKEGQNFEIIGVVKDMLMASPFRPVKQTIFLLGYENVNWIEMKLSANRGTRESLDGIEAIFKKHIPEAPFTYMFVQEQHARKFATEERIGTLSGLFGVLAIMISCLGLFGLASFVASQRTKEIGIRKVMGASVMALWKMLSKDFIVLVMISSVIAVPVAYLTMKSWLANYPYHIEISWWIFIATITGAIVLTLATVSYQSIKAALMNPVNSLRSE